MIFLTKFRMSSRTAQLICCGHLLTSDCQDLGMNLMKIHVVEITVMMIQLENQLMSILRLNIQIISMSSWNATTAASLKWSNLLKTDWRELQLSWAGSWGKLQSWYQQIVVPLSPLMCWEDRSTYKQPQKLGGILSSPCFAQYLPFVRDSLSELMDLTLLSSSVPMRLIYSQSYVKCWPHLRKSPRWRKKRKHQLQSSPTLHTWSNAQDGLASYDLQWWTHAAPAECCIKMPDTLRHIICVQNGSILGPAI